MSEALTAWLAGIPEDELSALLTRRPDVLLGRPPTTLAELAERWGSPESLSRALRQLSRPQLQAVEALCALGERRTFDELAGLLSGVGPDHRDDVVVVLAHLQGRALMWPLGDGRLAVPSALPAMFPMLLGGAGRPLRPSWATSNADDVRKALRAVGVRPEGRKAELVEALVGRLAEPSTVRRLLDSAPEQVRSWLEARAWSGVEPGGDPDAEPDEYGYDPLSYQQRMAAEQWGVAHGLLVGGPWGMAPALPSEISLAIRGPAYRAPFDAAPPRPSPGEMTPEQLRSAAAGAASAFAARAVGLLDRAAHSPLPRLATGGIGVRDLAKLARAHGSDAEMRLALELASAVDLIAPGRGGVSTTELFGDWRNGAPAEQVATLIEAWWELPMTPTDARDADGKARRALADVRACSGCRDARLAVVQAAAALPTGTSDRRGLALTALWERPLAHRAQQDGDALLGTVLHECELLGVIAGGALTPVGRALLDGDGSALRAVLTELLPASSDRAGFGSDLTAVVVGSPSSRLTRLLDACADRESSGGAVTWRFSPASIRRAMDDGAHPDRLLDELAGLSDRALPQMLSYLVGDVARRHGRIRGVAVASVLRSDDEALLAEVAADRRLAALGLRLLAPTVVGCAVPLPAAIERLRAVGYAPMADDDPGSASTEADPRGARLDLFRRPRPQRTARPAAPDAGALARCLLAAGPDTPSAPSSGLADAIGTEARRLARHEVEQLADAIEHGGRALIEYESSSGSVTRRVIADPELSGRSVIAYCELRQAERVFTLLRIRSVEPM